MSTEQNENKNKFSRLKTTKILKKEKPKAVDKDPKNDQQQDQKPNQQQQAPQGLSNKDKANFDRLLKQKEKEIDQLRGKVTEYNSKESRSNLETECKAIFAEVGIHDNAVKDVLDIVCNNFTLTNGKLLNAKGQKGDVANFLREYTKERQYLLQQRKGSGIKSHSGSTKMNGATSSGSFAEYRESRTPEKNKK